MLTALMFQHCFMQCYFLRLYFLLLFVLLAIFMRTPQRPLFININAGVLLEHGKVWNIRKVERHADTYMILVGSVLRFYGFIKIEKVDVSIRRVRRVETIKKYSSPNKGI